MKKTMGAAIVAMAAMVFSATPASAAQIEGGALQNTAKPSLFLASVIFDWNDGLHQVFRDDVGTAGVASFPAVGSVGPLVLDGFCIPADDDSHLTGWSIVIPEGDRSDCLLFLAESVGPALYTFRVQDARADGGGPNGRYFGDGDNGGVLDLMATTPIMTFQNLEESANPAPTVTSPTTVTNPYGPIEGQTQPDLIVEIRDGDDNLLCQTTADSEGLYSCTLTVPLSLGANVLFITAHDDGEYVTDTLEITITLAAVPDGGGEGGAELADTGMPEWAAMSSAAALLMVLAGGALLVARRRFAASR